MKREAIASRSTDVPMAMRKLPKSNSSLSAMSITSVARKPPRTEPATPRRIVQMIPIDCRPGSNRRAIAPTKRPQKTHERTPMLRGYPAAPRLLPLDGARRFRRDVEHHPVHLPDLVDHARGDLLDQVVRQPRPVGGHRVVRGDRADHDDVAVGPLVPLHANRAEVAGQDAERLPQLAVQAGRADLVLQDEVGVAQDLEPLLGDLAADDPDAEPRPRERLAPHEPLG